MSNSKILIQKTHGRMINRWAEEFREKSEVTHSAVFGVFAESTIMTFLDLFSLARSYHSHQFLLTRNIRLHMNHLSSLLLRYPGHPHELEMYPITVERMFL